jgi:diguanylate cyclase (GGDEF)-like protein
MKGRKARPTNEERAARRFRVRLIGTIGLTLAVMGVVSYKSMAHELRTQLLRTYSAEHKADAQNIGLVATRTRGKTETFSEIQEMLDEIARRPNVVETLLIDRRGVVQASADRALIGSTDSDDRIEAALRQGADYAGRERDPDLDLANFEFVSAIDLPSGRYALEISRDHALLDDQLATARRTMILATLGLLLLGGGVFYLVGGRALMRSHRRALARATHDGLTDLPNQRAFHHDLVNAVAAAERGRRPLALALIDVDDFRFGNDRYGHNHGDDVLKRVATVLRKGRAADRIYRVGGDEFALLLADTDTDNACAAARRLSVVLNEVGVGISIGIGALSAGQTAQTLRAEADAACNEAKRRGGKRIVLFADIRDSVVLTSPEKIRTVRQLLEEQSLTMHFQPIWDLEVGALLGIEALARPDASYALGPAEAFDVAAQIGRTRELDILCARRTMEIAPDLPPDVLIFLNVAPQTLDLAVADDTWLARTVEEAGLTPDRVVIEITERFSGRTASIVQSLRRLQRQGFKLALDDVGAGNSGLEMLRQVDVDFVKIDRSIVAAAPTEPNARAVLMAMATFAKQTDAFVIAEGIEDVELLEFVQEVAQDGRYTEKIIQGAQGYGLGRPAPSLPSDPRIPISLVVAA